MNLKELKDAVEYFSPKGEMSLEGAIKELAPINCFYNHKPDADGRCYSTECVFSQDAQISAKIKSEGCTIYKNIQEIHGKKVFSSLNP